MSAEFDAALGNALGRMQIIEKTHARVDFHGAPGLFVFADDLAKLIAVAEAARAFEASITLETTLRLTTALTALEKD